MKGQDPPTGVESLADVGIVGPPAACLVEIGEGGDDEAPPGGVLGIVHDGVGLAPGPGEAEPAFGAERVEATAVLGTKARAQRAAFGIVLSNHGVPHRCRCGAWARWRDPGCRARTCPFGTGRDA